MRPALRGPGRTMVWTLLYASMLCIALYAYRIWQLKELTFSYLPWNLFLAWIPLGIVLLLVQVLKKRPWSDWGSILLTLVWLLFLPNAFYMLTDYIHIQELTGENVLYDVVLFTMFIFVGLVLGFSSLFVFHYELLKHVRAKAAWAWVLLVLLISSFAIFIGRDLRWNSWDVFASPLGLLFDLSDRVVNPSTYGNVYGTFVGLFLLLSLMYVVGYRLVALSERVSHAPSGD